MTHQERANLCSQLSLEPSSIVSLYDNPNDLRPWHFLVLKVDYDLNQVLMLRLTDAHPAHAPAGHTTHEELDDMLLDLTSNTDGLAWRKF